MEAQPENINPAVDSPIAWEAEDGGFIQRLWLTINQVLLRPQSSFVPPLDRISPFKYLYFGLIMGMFGPVVSNIWDMILVRNGGVSGYFWILSAVTQMALTLVVGSALCHIFLWVFQGTYRTFMATFRVMCYCQSASILFVFPFAGELVGSIYSLVLLVIGLSVTHATGWVRSMMAVICSIAVVILFTGLLIMG